MALNNRAPWRVMTNFERLLIRLHPFKSESPTTHGEYQATQMAIIQTPIGQTANALEIQDYSTGPGKGNILAAVDPNGNLVYGGGQLAAGGAAKQLQCIQRFPLTAAQIISMGTTPITIIPAPSALTSFIVVHRITIELDLTATAFASGGVVHFYYHGQTTEIMAQTIAAATINGSSGQSFYALAPVQTAGGSVITPGVGIDITAATAFTTGTGTAVVTVWYSIVTAG